MAGQPTLAVHISLTLRPKSVYSNLAEELLIYVNTWVPILPGVMIFLTSMAFNLLSDGLRDAMDVRL